MREIMLFGLPALVALPLLVIGAVQAVAYFRARRNAPPPSWE